LQAEASIESGQHICFWARSVNGSTLRLHRRSGRSTRPVSTKVSGCGVEDAHLPWEQDYARSNRAIPTKFRRAPLNGRQPASNTGDSRCTSGVEFDSSALRHHFFFSDFNRITSVSGSRSNNSGFWVMVVVKYLRLSRPSLVRSNPPNSRSFRALVNVTPPGRSFR
jgi:hypothetical protein